jgi:hypothetical protein
MRRLYPSITSVQWTTHRVAGVYYHREAMGADYEKMRARHKENPYVGVWVNLERDPGNRYDANAIKIIETETKSMIGWIPKEENAPLAMIMDKLGIEFNGCLNEDCNFSTNRLSVRIFALIPATMDHLMPSTKAAATLGALVESVKGITKPTKFSDYELDL